MKNLAIDLNWTALTGVLLGDFDRRGDEIACPLFLPLPEASRCGDLEPLRQWGVDDMDQSQRHIA
jgi:hypothetical protein